jgi:hypothetical protein
VLHDQDIAVRDAASNTLGLVGPSDLTIIPTLVDAFTDKKSGIRISPAASLQRIADGLEGQASHLSDATLDRAITNLQSADKALESWQPSTPQDISAIRKDKADISRAINALKREQQSRIREHVINWVSHNKAVTVILCWLVWILLLYVIMLIFPPLWFLPVNDALKFIDKWKLPEQLNFLELLPRYVLGIGFFCYHPRVLDAWVRKYADVVRENLRKRPTFVEHGIYVDIPINFPDGEKRPTASDFHTLFSQKRALLRLWGDGGSGKTTLACEIAIWALGNKKTDRLCESHRMLPIFLEENLAGAKPGESAPLLAEIRGSIGRMIGEGEIPSEDLVKSLLRKRRILLIVDGYSELDEATQKSIRLHDSVLNLNALVVTSRLEDTLNDGGGLTLKTGLLKGQGIAAFVDDYIQRAEKRGLFTDPMFYNDIKELTELVGNHEVTALLAQLYARYMIDRQESSSVERPQNVPELMDAYVNEMCLKADKKTYLVHIYAPLAYKIAWNCIKTTLIPTATPLANITTALRQTDDGIELPAGQSDQDALVTVFVDKLRLLQRQGSIKDNLKFTLDPLGEYLAAQYLVKYGYRNNVDAWNRFLEEAQAKPNAPQSIAGFLRALEDTLEAKGQEGSVPNSVLLELRRRFASVLSVPTSLSTNSRQTVVQPSGRKTRRKRK